jgi:WD40 repeat protein
MLAIGSGGRPVVLWDVAQRRQVGEIPGDPCVYGLAFSPDDKLLALGDMNGCELQVWEVTTLKQKFRAVRDRHDITSLAFSPDGMTLVTVARWISTLKILDVASGMEVASLEHDDAVWSVAFSPDGKKIATASGWLSGKNAVRVFDIATRKEIQNIKLDSDPKQVAFWCCGRCVAILFYGKATLVSVDP